MDQKKAYKSYAYNLYEKRYLREIFPKTRLIPFEGKLKNLRLKACIFKICRATENTIPTITMRNKDRKIEVKTE